jgi:hypothetical protein
MRQCWSLAVMVVAALVARPGGAQPAASADEHAACMQAFEQTQLLRKSGELLAAREQVRRCMAGGCLEVVSAKCAGWLGELDQQIPSIVVRVVDADGTPLPVTGLLLDQAPAPELRAGRAREIDPGQHALSAELEGGERLELSAVVLEGRKNQLFELRRPAPEPAPAPPVEPTPPAAAPAPAPATPPTDTADAGLSGLGLAAWISFGVGLAGVSVGAITGAIALDSAAECEEIDCTGEQIDERAVVADVSTAAFVVGGVGLLSAVTFAMIDSIDDEPASAARLRLVLTPTSAALRGSF